MASISATTRAMAATRQKIQWAIGGWLFFVGENLVLSENRTYLIEVLGDGKYHAIYGTFSTIATIGILYGYRKLSKNHLLQGSAIPLAARLGAGAVIGTGMLLASQVAPKLQIPVTRLNNNADDVESSSVSKEPAGWKVRCPFDFTDHSSSNGESSVCGVERVSRHPGLWALGLVSAGNGLLQPTLPLTLWFMGPALIALIGGSHADSRYRRGMGGTLSGLQDYQTSNVPFLAMVMGRQGNDAFGQFVQEIKPLNAVLGVVAAGVWVASRGRVSPKKSLA